jgi:threonine dehydrogenase-like Zn-dependent dehydrogenase
MKSLFFDVSVAKILATKSLSKLTESVYFSPLSPVRFGDVPERELPGANWVRVKTTLASICGADLSLFFVQASPKISIAALPGVPRVFLGHELVGRVIEVGAGVQDFVPGDRVTLQKYLPCCSIKEIEPPCLPCQQGNYTLCENFSEGPSYENLGAGFSEQFLAHRSQLVKVPGEISDDTAVLIEPAAVSLHAVLKRLPRDGENVLVIGAGTIGLNVIQFARVFGPNCTIYLLEKIPFKQEFGLKLGADRLITGEPYAAISEVIGAKVYRGPLNNTNMLGGFDLIYDCVGYSRTIHDSLRWLRAGGDYVMVGNQLSPVTFDQTPIWQQELRIWGINAHGCEEFDGQRISSFDLAIKMILENSISFDGFITHRFPLQDYRQAFKVFRQKQEPVIKVVFEIGK